MCHFTISANIILHTCLNRDTKTPNTHTQKTMNSISALILSANSLVAPLSAAVVYADFNDNTTGALGNFSAGAGQGGGSGFLAGDVWANTGSISIIAGDLSAPSGTNYAITQGSPTAQSVQGNFASARHTTRATATTMGTSSDIWFSFLLNQPTTNSRGGITFNQNTSAPGNPRIIATGTEVRLGLGATLNATGVTIGLNTTALILGQLIIDSAGNETFNVWADPDVSGGISGLGAPDTTLTENANSLNSGVTRVGVQSYASDSQGGIFDALILSDDSNSAQAFADVTGVLVPEPSSALLTLLGGIALLRRRR